MHKNAFTARRGGVFTPSYSRLLLGVIAAIAGVTITASTAAAATLPNVALTPGAIATRDTQEVCSRGYASQIRPRGQLWVRLKRSMYERYGLPRGARYGYAADHLIPLELGGAPADERNLWPEPYSEAHEKDRVEDALHILVCDDRMTLPDAQQRIARDWTTAIPATITLTARERAELERLSSPTY